MRNMSARMMMMLGGKGVPTSASSSSSSLSIDPAKFYCVAHSMWIGAGCIGPPTWTGQYCALGANIQVGVCVEALPGLFEKDLYVVNGPYDTLGECFIGCSGAPSSSSSSSASSSSSSSLSSSSSSSSSDSSSSSSSSSDSSSSSSSSLPGPTYITLNTAMNGVTYPFLDAYEITVSSTFTVNYTADQAGDSHGQPGLEGWTVGGDAWQNGEPECFYSTILSAWRAHDPDNPNHPPFYVFDHFENATDGADGFAFKCPATLAVIHFLPP